MRIETGESQPNAAPDRVRPPVPSSGACPNCSSQGGRVVLKECEDLLHGVNGRWSLVECPKCGLIRTDPMPSDNQIAALYPSNYSPHHRETRPAGVRGVGALLRRIAVSPYELRFGPAGIACRPFGAVRFLDVGCGAGALLRKMVDAGWNGTGVDISSSAITEARSRIPEGSFFVGTIESASLDGPYDLIAMQHVLEHVPRPTECLRRCFDLLSPGGILLIALPNFQSIEALLLRRRWVGLDIPRHLVHFREPVLVDILQSCGYEVARRRPQMFASSISESLLLLLPTGARRKVIGSPIARALYVSLVFPACISYFFGNRGAVEIHARKPS